ncbi:MAG: VWA domain-containing protein [Verrucomicrobia bacterium]|nr:MAG: VWA domain-containing protein [Verrucomicrobiota bacterium]
MIDFFQRFQFAQPAWLLLLLLCLPLLWLRRGRGADAAVTFPNLSVLISLGKPVRKTAWGLAVPLAWLALVTCIVTLARPVLRNEYQNHTASGIDIVIALDVSLSMNIDDFVDQGRQAKRIDVAKTVVDEFISGRPEDRIGLVAFSGRPRDCSPITLDHEWLRAALREVRLNKVEENLGTVKEQGTAIGSAIAAASSRLQSRDAKSRVVVLITDGASNSGKISPLEAAENAKVLGIKIYTVAIGTIEGRVDPSIQRFPYQEFDLPTLQKIASLTGAEHYWAQNLKDLKTTFNTIDRLEKTEAKSYTFTEDIELYGPFLGLAIILTILAGLAICLSPEPQPI